MPRTENTPRQLLTLQSTGDGSRTYLSPRYQQTYHSHFGAVTEARHVFLDTSGIAARLTQGHSCTVLEVGFGLGLNYLLTADMAATHSALLHYEAYENDLISATDFDALEYGHILTHPELAERLSTALGSTELSKSDISTRSATQDLLVHKQDIQTATYPQGHFDAIYLDAFSPPINPECWTQPLFHRFYAALKAGGTLATYCVKGSVRRDLEKAGFATERLPGPPGKREILKAIRTDRVSADYIDAILVRDT